MIESVQPQGIKLSLAFSLSLAAGACVLVCWYDHPMPHLEEKVVRERFRRPECTPGRFSLTHSLIYVERHRVHNPGQGLELMRALSKIDFQNTDSEPPLPI